MKIKAFFQKETVRKVKLWEVLLLVILGMMLGFMIGMSITPGFIG